MPLLESDYLKAIKELKTLEIPQDVYFSQRLTDRDAINLSNFRDQFLGYMNKREIPISLLAIGSSTYPLINVRKIEYQDIDVLALAHDPKLFGPKGNGTKTLINTVNEYLAENYGEENQLDCFEVNNREARFLPYGRPNSEIKIGLSLIHLVVEDKLTFEEQIERERKENLPFSLIHYQPKN